MKVYLLLCFQYFVEARRKLPSLPRKGLQEKSHEDFTRNILGPCSANDGLDFFDLCQSRRLYARDDATMDFSMSLEHLSLSFSTFTKNDPHTNRSGSRPGHSRGRRTRSPQVHPNSFDRWWESTRGTLNPSSERSSSITMQPSWTALPTHESVIIEDSSPSSHSPVAPHSYPPAYTGRSFAPDPSNQFGNAPPAMTPTSVPPAAAPPVHIPTVPVEGPAVYSPTIVTLSAVPSVTAATDMIPTQSVPSAAFPFATASKSNAPAASDAFSAEPSMQPERPSIVSGDSSSNPSTILLMPSLRKYNPVLPSSRHDTEQPSTELIPGHCRTIDGIYGSLSGFRILVAFGFELETVFIGEEEMLHHVLPELEGAFNDYLLPYLDPSRCGSPFHHRYLQTIVKNRRRLLEVVGIDSRPEDVPVDDCASTQDDGSSCVVFRGELSLYLKSPAVKSVLVAETQEHLIEGMANGVFNDVDDRIIRVTYVDFSSVHTINPIESQEQPRSGNEADTVNTVLIGVLSVVSGVILLSVGAVTVYRRRAVTMSRRYHFERMVDEDANHMVDTGSEMGLVEPAALEAIKEEKRLLDDSDAKMESEHQDDEHPFITAVSSLYLEPQADGELLVKATCATTSILSESDDAFDHISPSDSSVYMEGQDTGSPMDSESELSIATKLMGNRHVTDCSRLVI